MMDRLRRRAYALIALVALALPSAGTFGPAPAGAAPFPSPLESAVMQTPPPLSATATPPPSGQIVKYSGQLLDYRDGFAFFTTGDAFRVDPSAKIDDAATGGPTALVPETRTYARASFDEGSGGIVELALSRTKLPDEASYQEIKKFAVVLSTPYANPDLARGGEGFNGKPVPVTFLVEIPPKTPFSEQIYLSTDASGWSATAVRMDRVDALHYRVVRSFSSGTRLLYRYTRGSWQSADVGQDGLAIKPRVLVVPNADYLVKRDVVYYWQDENPFASDNGDTLPTPFNPVPFNIPAHH
jgi:hypothetical protein